MWDWRMYSKWVRNDEAEHQFTSLNIIELVIKETSAALANSLNSTTKRYSDKYHRDIPAFVLGSLVLLDGKGIEIQSPPKKLDNKRHGLFEVVERVRRLGTNCTGSYRLRIPPTWKIHDVFHISKLVPFKMSLFSSHNSSSKFPKL
jgi:hypothetical protein